MAFPNCNSSSGNTRFPLYFTLPARSSSESTLTSKNKLKKEKTSTKIGVGNKQNSSETSSKNSVGTPKSCSSKSDTSLNGKVKLEKRLFYPSPTTKSKLHPKGKAQNPKEKEKKSHKDTPRPSLTETKVLDQDVFAEPSLRDASKKKKLEEVTKAVSEIPFAEREEFKDKTQEVAANLSIGKAELNLKDVDVELGDEIPVKKNDEERRVSFEDKIEFIEVFDSPVMTESNSLKFNRISDRPPTPRPSTCFIKSLEEEAVSEKGNGTGDGFNVIETSPVKMVPFLKDIALSKTNASSDSYNLNPKLAGFIDRLVANTLNSAIREAAIISSPNSPSTNNQYMTSPLNSVIREAATISTPNSSSTDDQEMTSPMNVSLRLERLGSKSLSNNNPSLVLTLDKFHVGQRVDVEARFTKERSYVSLTFDPRENEIDAERTVSKMKSLLEPIDEDFQTTKTNHFDLSLEPSSDNLSRTSSVSRSNLLENKRSVLNVHAEPFYPSLESGTVPERTDNGSNTRNGTTSTSTVVVSQSRGTWCSHHQIRRGVSCSPQETMPNENYSSLMNTRSVVELAAQMLETVSIRDHDLERILKP